MFGAWEREKKGSILLAKSKTVINLSATRNRTVLKTQLQLGHTNRAIKLCLAQAPLSPVEESQFFSPIISA